MHYCSFTLETWLPGKSLRTQILWEFSSLALQVSSSIAELEENIKIGEVWIWRLQPCTPLSLWTLYSREDLCLLWPEQPAVHLRTLPNSSCLWKLRDHYTQSKMELASSGAISVKQSALQCLGIKALTQRRDFKAGNTTAFPRTV